MKKVRIMLAAIAVLGTVGGALAFKAKDPVRRYCIAPITTTACSTTITANFTVRDGVANLRYTPTSNVANCPALNCPFSGLVEHE